MYQYILYQKCDIPLKTPKMYQYILDLKWENAQNVPLHFNKPDKQVLAKQKP